MLYVLFLNLSFKLPHTASILSPAEKIWFRIALNESPLLCQPEVVLNIEGDSHVGGLPLYVELVTRFQADQEYVCECFRTLFFKLPPVKRVGDQERRKQRNQNEKQYW